MSNITLLNKLKPRGINIDKERLYQENLELKMKFNSDQDDILKLKTRVLQVEKELQRKDSPRDDRNYCSVKPPNMIINLKSTIKELRSQILAKDDEIERLNKNLKSSKIIELESEVKTYIDECSRLRRHLEESFGRGTQSSFNTEAEKNSKLVMLIESMEKENKDLLKKLKDYREEIETLKKMLANAGDFKKTVKVKGNEIVNAKQELRKIKDQNEQLAQSVKEAAGKEFALRDEVKNLKKSLKDQKNRAILAEQQVKEFLLKLKDPGNSKEVLKFSEGMLYASLKTQEGPNQLMFFLEKIITKNRLTTETFFSMIDKHNTKTILFSDFESIIKKFDSSFAQELINLVPKVVITHERFINIDSLRTLYQESQIIPQNKPAETFTFDSPVKKTDGKSLNLLQFPQDKPKQIYLDREKFPSGTHTPVDNFNCREKTSLDQKGTEIKPSNPENKSISDKSGKKKISRKVAEISLSDDDTKKVGVILSGKHIDKSKKELNSSGDDLKKAPKIPVPRTDSSKKQSKPIKDSKSSQERLSNASTTPTPITDPLLINILKHISYRMQLNRLSKSKLLLILFGSTDKERSPTKPDLISYFSKDPFSFTDPSDHLSLSNFLLSPTCTIKTISDKLLCSLPDWHIFSKEDEAEFDSELGKLISSHKSALMERCKAYDKDHKGLITSAELEAVLEVLNLSISDKIYNYLRLLCYSYDFKLELVPYRYLIKAYGNSAEVWQEEEASELSESLDHEHISQYLAVIAQVLQQNNLEVADVFECDGDGRIFTKGFCEGLRRIGLEKIEEAHVREIIDALRFQGEEELCMQIQELDEILQGYRDGNEDSPEFEEETHNRISLFGSNRNLKSENEIEEETHNRISLFGSNRNLKSENEIGIEEESDNRISLFGPNRNLESENEIGIGIEEESDNRISLFGPSSNFKPVHGSERFCTSNEFERLRKYSVRSMSEQSDEYNPFE